jgi:hypothetical protein
VPVLNQSDVHHGVSDSFVRRSDPVDVLLPLAEHKEPECETAMRARAGRGGTCRHARADKRTPIYSQEARRECEKV